MSTGVGSTRGLNQGEMVSEAVWIQMSTPEGWEKERDGERERERKRGSLQV